MVQGNIKLYHEGQSVHSGSQESAVLSSKRCNSAPLKAITVLVLCICELYAKEEHEKLSNFVSSYCII